MLRITEAGIYMHINIYTYIYMYMYICVHVYRYTQKNLQKEVCVRCRPQGFRDSEPHRHSATKPSISHQATSGVFTGYYSYTHTNAHIYIYTHVSMYTLMCVYRHAHTYEIYRHVLDTYTFFSPLGTISTPNLLGRFSRSSVFGVASGCLVWCKCVQVCTL